ncbi:sugar transferase [Candidatus Methylopumilus universalis]|uniref:sugar transferase n=1 Tax=Candidatus Methylopumilus universalis TaxID=2588536 RepID=UPI00112001AE|nr:sugar transferase [Candidatus Methylopumilus universalis]QDC97803.1 sugar transferase [Candidatus Methylopumilus universalis]
MKSYFDYWLSFFLIFVLLPIITLIALSIKLTSKGPVVYWSKRVGTSNAIFKMPKFRTMYLATPAVASHLLKNPSQYLTPIGSFLRRTSLDEIPQLWSILLGDMSFVGPRPALFNQYNLIKLRTSKGIHHLVPGLTGWAQVNGRDDLSIAEKVNFDIEYLKKKSFYFDLKILCLTFIKIFRREGIQH